MIHPRIFLKLLPRLSALLLLMLTLAWAGSAEAGTVTIGCNQVTYDTSTPPNITNVTSTMSSLGFSVGLVYCVKLTIYQATFTYIKSLSAALLSYRFLAITIVLVMFGIKLMTVSVKDLTKEGLGLFIRIAVMLFLVDNASYLYIALTDGMGQMIGWVSAGFNTVASCQPPTNTGTVTADVWAQLYAPQGEYAVWQIYDCLFKSIAGAATSTPVILTSLLIIVAAAIFTSTIGIILVLMGITALVSVFLMLLRSLYMVLLAYITLSFLCILTPLIAPLLLFEKKEVRGIFDKWIELIVSTIFQPIFVIGFLCFATMALDMFIDGNMRNLTSGGAPVCTVPTQAISLDANNNCVYTAIPTDGSGDGSGVCSFTDLLNPKGYTDTPVASCTPPTSCVPSVNPCPCPSQKQLLMQCALEQNATLWTWSIGGDPQGRSDDNNPVDLDSEGFWASVVNTASGAVTRVYHRVKSAVINGVNRVLSAMASLAFGGVTRLRLGVPIRQLCMTLLAFFITARVMWRLIDTIPEMARTITGSVGLELAKEARIPLESAIIAGLQGAGESMKSAAASGTGGFTGAAKTLGRVGVKGITGGFAAAKDKIAKDYFQ